MFFDGPCVDTTRCWLDIPGARLDGLLQLRPKRRQSAARLRCAHIEIFFSCACAGSQFVSVYNSLNGYRMAAQQTPGPVTGYIANTAAGFINNAQIPMQMGVMNMAQTQYQDPTAIQRAAQQNTMYTYGYINSVMQPLNGTMRR
jgi:hypothetical protein